ncbi:NADH dehydrogenase (ubiquinone) complex I, assembly factor 6 [Folsomia candida]|uniref:NADH dehydrogenase (ubiquinone) complex I, assembly factor 6 n=1 Tax=Folsomia candida TaxID=158441 RepID=UPI000B8FFA36|nr:NADH dehydrogenase (ubiquinone) complex I, assembly factor 6 [Folsomia candida]
MSSFFQVLSRTSTPLGFVRPLSSSTTAKTTKGPHNSSITSYCSDLVRRHDYEMFLCTLLIPDPILRTKVMTVRAFNTEVAIIRDQVSQKEIGLSRLVFWREAVNQLYLSKKADSSYKNVPRQPTVLGMSKVIFEHDVSKKWLVNLLDGRERLMSDVPFTDLSDLEAYCDQTVTSILFITFEILGVKNVDVDHASSHLGKAIGLGTFARSIPYNAQNRRVLVPRDMLIKHGLSQEDFIRNKQSEKIKELVYEIASHAHIHYDKAKSMSKLIDKKALPLFLAGVPTDIYLKRLQRVQFDPYHPSLTTKYRLLPWHLYFRKIKGSYF